MNDMVTQLREERNGYRITVNDSETFRLSFADFRAFPLREGETLDFAQYRKNLLFRQYPEALNRAVALLATRSRSRYEVEQRLLARGYLADTVEIVLYKLEKEHLLDDAAFAAAWTQARSTRGLGNIRLRQELYQKGVDSETAAAAINSLDEEEQVQSAVAFALKTLARHRNDPAADARRKTLAAMQRRGYSYAEASRALQTALEAQHDTERE